MVLPGKTPSSNHKVGTPRSNGINDFFNFYSELQQSAAYYSTLALRQMMVGYQNPVGMGTSEECLLPTPVPVSKVTGKRINSKGDTPAVLVLGAQDSSIPHISSAFCIPPRRAPQVKVVVSACDTDSDDNEVAAEMGSPRQRKVNFATPLSTIKIKSPTPIHSMEELNGGHVDTTKTGFTSDSEVEGSETDVWCQYAWRVRNVEQNQLQVPSGNAAGGGKKRKKRRKKKNKNSKNTENGEDKTSIEGQSQWNTEEDYNYAHYDEDDANAIYEMPLNEDDYEFISDIRRCGAATTEEKNNVTDGTTESGKLTGGNKDKEDARMDDMKLLYGGSGSVRILKIEDTIEDCFKTAMKKVNGRKY